MFVYIQAYIHKYIYTCDIHDVYIHTHTHTCWPQIRKTLYVVPNTFKHTFFKVHIFLSSSSIFMIIIFPLLSDFGF